MGEIALGVNKLGVIDGMGHGMVVRWYSYARCASTVVGRDPCSSSDSAGLG